MKPFDRAAQQIEHGLIEERLVALAKANATRDGRVATIEQMPDLTGVIEAMATALACVRTAQEMADSLLVDAMGMANCGERLN